MDNKKKLLIYHTCLPPYRIDLFNLLSKDFEVKAILFGKPLLLNRLGFNMVLVEAEAEFPYEWHNRGVFLGNHLFSNMYYKVTKAFRPDVIWCQELGINTLCTILMKRCFRYKIVINVDDSPAMLEQYGTIRRLLRRFVYKYVDEVFVVHRDVKDILDKEFPHCHFHYLPLIQSEKKFCGKLESGSDIAQSYSSQYGLEYKTIFLFVGRLENVKQPMMLLRAFHKSKIENALLVFVGDGTLHNEMEQYVVINQLQHCVILTGKLQGDALYAWYRVADYFVLPSIYEPFGAVVNEALLAGCKVIISNRVGASTLVNGINGVVIPYDGEMELIKKLEEFHVQGKKTSMNSLMDISFNAMYQSLKSNLMKW